MSRFIQDIPGLSTGAGRKSPATPHSCNEQNLSQRERTLSVLAGAALFGLSVWRRKPIGLVLGGVGAALVVRGVSGHCHVYDALGIDTSQHNPATAIPAQTGVKVEKSLTVHRSAQELFQYWRQLSNLAQVMRHVKSVEVLDPQHSRWVAAGPLGMTLTWDAEIFNERPNELIAWRSLPGGQLETAGSIHFKQLEHQRGTAVSVSMKYNPPAGKLGDNIASLLGRGLEQELDEDLHRFKSLMEAGEIAVA